MPIPVLPAASGWRWFVRSLALLGRHPWQITLTISLLMIVSIALIFMPVVGTIAGMLWSPVFAAGILLTYHRLEQGQSVSLEAFLRPCKEKPAALFGLSVLTGIASVGTLSVLLLLLSLASGTPFLEVVLMLMIYLFAVLYGMLHDPIALQRMIRMIPEALNHFPPEILLLAFVCFLLWLVALFFIVMVSWFAPSLIVWQRLSMQQAIRISLIAGWRNKRAFLVSGLLLVGGGVILGIVLLQLAHWIRPSPPSKLLSFITICVSSYILMFFYNAIWSANVYHSYRDLFAKIAPESEH
jgi:hypothetical protein